MDFFQSLLLSQWLLIAVGAFLIGLSKAGIRGIDVAQVTIMAFIFGSKASTGIVLLLLCLADVFSVSYYHRHAQWKYLKILMPWLIIGVLIGVFLGKDMNEGLFRKSMALIILAAISLLFLFEYKKNIKIPEGGWFGSGMGLISGITTMLGNLAGAFSTLYFMALKVPKDHFIGTVSWLFLIINLFKVPFQIVFWKNVTIETIKYDLILAPFVIIGFFIGVRIVKRMTNDAYRKMVLALTLVGALAMLIK